MLPIQSGPFDIWLVEDNDFYRKSVQSILQKTNIFLCSHAFVSCEDALQSLETEPPPSAILLDIGLPGMSGLDGIEKIKAFTPSTEIVILTIHDDDEKLFNAICAGASGYLLKNSSKERIVEAISEVLSGGSPMNPAMARKALTIFRQLGSTPKPVNYGLTQREKEVLQFLIEGCTKKQIADTLFLSFHTVNTHLKNIYSKLHVNTRSGVVSKVYKERLL